MLLSCRQLVTGPAASRRRQPCRCSASASASAPALPYEVLQSRPGYELRLYGAYVVACTPYETRPEGLAVLSDYLAAAGNAGGATLPATQPLVTRYEPGANGELLKWMLLRVAAQTPPQPAPALADFVRLRVAGGEAVACATLMGAVTPARAEAERAALCARLAADGRELAVEDAGGGFRLATYGPLYSLQERTNELWLRVTL